MWNPAAFLRLASLSGLALAFFVATAVADDPVRVLKESFFSQRPFGALAWIDGVADQNAAEQARIIGDMSRSQSRNPCYVLPLRKDYWFLLSHRDVLHANQIGYFAIRIVGHSSSASPAESLRVYRSPGWVRDDGVALSELVPDPSSLSIGVRKFIDLHDDASGLDEMKRLDAIAKGVGNFHGRAHISQENSWVHRKIFADNSHLPPTQNSELLVYGARLIRFTATSETTSFRPMVFHFNPSGVTSFFISVATPGFELANAETEVRIGQSCDQQTSSVGFFERVFGQR
jgi:hypothetical protein